MCRAFKGVIFINFNCAVFSVHNAVVPRRAVNKIAVLLSAFTERFIPCFVGQTEYGSGVIRCINPNKASGRVVGINVLFYFRRSRRRLIYIRRRTVQLPQMLKLCFPQGFILLIIFVVLNPFNVILNVNYRLFKLRFCSVALCARLVHGLVPYEQVP